MKPPSKKQKTKNGKDGAKQKPVVFAWPGMTPDTCLIVFNHEFHVHSVILKLHSTFFRKFFDSPEKNNVQMNQPWATDLSKKAKKSCSGPTMLYRWVTKVEDEYSWCLVSEDMRNAPYGDVSTFEYGPIRAELNFERLLKAIYNRPYTFNALSELSDLVELADYYCAVPVVSRTLSLALLQGDFGYDIQRRKYEALELGVKLRNKILFQEAMIHCVSDYVSLGYFDWGLYPNRKIANVVYHAGNALLGKILAIDDKVAAKAHDDSHFNAIRAGAYQKGIDEGDGLFHKSVYFRSLYEELDSLREEDEKLEDLHYDLSVILQNNLQTSSRYILAGTKSSEVSFVSATITDEDLPWDDDEIDW